MYKPNSKIQKRNRAYKAAHYFAGKGKLRAARRSMRTASEEAIDPTPKQYASILRVMNWWARRPRLWPFNWFARFWAMEWSV